MWLHLTEEECLAKGDFTAPAGESASFESHSQQNPTGHAILHFEHPVHLRRLLKSRLQSRIDRPPLHVALCSATPWRKSRIRNRIRTTNPTWTRQTRPGPSSCFSSTHCARDQRPRKEEKRRQTTSCWRRRKCVVSRLLWPRWRRSICLAGKKQVSPR